MRKHVLLSCVKFCCSLNSLFAFLNVAIVKDLTLRKLFTFIGISLALAGCGSSSTNTPVTETLASFPNGAGVFRKDIVDPHTE